MRVHGRYLAVLMVIGLTACGTSQHDRAISGGGIGAAGGAVVGAVTGLTVLQGAAIGAGAGAVTGLLTDSEDINLGTPFWRRGQASSKPTNVAHNSMVANTQAGLSRLGYDPGPIDGVLGPRTSAAIREYQYDFDLPIDGNATPALEQHILAQR